MAVPFSFLRLAASTAITIMEKQISDTSPNKRWIVYLYRLLVGGMVWVGAMSTLDFVWGLADITMGLMAICNLIAIAFLGKYAFRLLQDYREQKKSGIKSRYSPKTR